VGRDRGGYDPRLEKGKWRAGKGKTAGRERLPEKILEADWEGAGSDSPWWTWQGEEVKPTMIPPTCHSCKN